MQLHLLKNKLDLERGQMHPAQSQREANIKNDFSYTKLIFNIKIFLDDSNIFNSSYSKADEVRKNRYL